MSRNLEEGDRSVSEIKRVAYGGDRANVRALIPADAHCVLDIGCAEGALGAALKAGGVREVVGVEVDAEAASQARGPLDEVHAGTVEEVLDAVADWSGRFDCIVAADVLEHMAWPDRVLERLRPCLAPGGSVVVSVPNVRHWRTFHALLVRGRWPREPAGLFDETHLRWFTRANLDELLRGAGYEPEVWRSVDDGGSWRSMLYRWIARTPLAPFITRQYLVRARLTNP